MLTDDISKSGAEDDEALDILWSMVMEEGNERAMKNLDSDSARTMLKSHAAFSAMLDMNESSENGVLEEVDMEEEDGIQIPQSPLAGVIDFTPESVLLEMGWKQVKVVVSCSTPLPEKHEDWERLLALVKVKRRTRWSAELVVKDVVLVPITPLNPYTCRCTIPLVGIVPGPRFLVMLETVLPETSRETAVSDIIRYAWAQSFQNLSNTDGKPLFFPSVNIPNASVRLLSQISNGYLDIVDPNKNSVSYTRDGDSEGSTTDNLSARPSTTSGSVRSTKVCPPAPDAALAFVAAALTDFPNPEITTAVPVEQLLPTADIQGNRKRTKSNICEDIFNNEDLVEAAQDWANAPSGDKQGESKLESLDRHCKVRLVERLTDVIKDTDNEANAQHVAKAGARPKHGHHRNFSISTPLHSKGSSILPVDDFQLNAEDITLLKGGSLEGTEMSPIENIDLTAINEDEIDSLLDGLLVRVVENLMELTSSPTELKDELDKPDQSGFTLLHYACLYNLSTLLPVLFFHGVSPDIPTTQGNMTPLHLACSAGNLSIVELLVQKGARILVQDSYGATPLDHAIRNGFPEVAKRLADKAGLEHPLSKSVTTVSPSHPNSVEFDVMNREMLMQNAFASMSLKDKIMLNLLEEKRRESRVVGDNMDIGDVTVEKNQDNEASYELFSKEEREGFAVALKLMSKEEQEDILQRTSGDMRKWVLMRNYEVLKESEEFCHSAKHVKAKKTPNKSVLTDKEMAKKRLDAAIAGLVLRKSTETPKK